MTIISVDLDENHIGQQTILSISNLQSACRFYSKANCKIILSKLNGLAEGRLG